MVSGSKRRPRRETSPTPSTRSMGKPSLCGKGLRKVGAAMAFGLAVTSTTTNQVQARMVGSILLAWMMALPRDRGGAGPGPADLRSGERKQSVWVPEPFVPSRPDDRHPALVTRVSEADVSHRHHLTCLAPASRFPSSEIGENTAAPETMVERTLGNSSCPQQTRRYKRDLHISASLCRHVARPPETSLRGQSCVRQDVLASAGGDHEPQEHLAGLAARGVCPVWPCRSRPDARATSASQATPPAVGVRLARPGQARHAGTRQPRDAAAAD
jgi:hypothetical protein